MERSKAAVIKATVKIKKMRIAFFNIQSPNPV